MEDQKFRQAAESPAHWTAACLGLCLVLLSPWAHGASLAELEALGTYPDDQLPLEPGIKPAAPEVPKDCAPHSEAYLKGHRESLAGQRFITYIGGGIKFSREAVTRSDFLPKDVSGKERREILNRHHPFQNRDRLACQEARKSDASEKELSCCEDGFRRGMRELAGYLEKGPDASCASSPELCQRYGQCWNAFLMGWTFGEEACEDARSAPPESCTVLMMRRAQTIRYLGCYHLGFLNRMSRCPAGAHAQRFVQTNEIRISDTRLKDLPEPAEQKPKAPLAPEATSAQGSSF